MAGLGTIINSGAIIVGGLLGLVIGNRITKRFQDIITIAMALSIMFMSIGSVVSEMLIIDGNNISTQGTFMMIFSLVLGGIVGEVINIDSQMERFGEWLKKKTGNAKDAAFVNAFVSASFTVCIGAMAVMGSIMDGINKDPSILVTKAIMDLIIILVMTASMGKGCIFSAIPVAIFQGTVTLLAGLIEPLMNAKAMSNLSLVGSVLIFCISLNLLFDGRYRVKVANLLPAICFAVAAAYVPFL